MRKKQKLIATENSEVELWQPPENTLMKTLRKQKAQGRLCDIVFIHGDVKIYSHACVLASCSPYIMELLLENTFIYRNDWCIKTPLMLNLTAILKQSEHVCCECFKNVIDYMYTDKIDMHKCHPNHVKYAATLLRITKLIRICTQYNIPEKTTTVTLNSTDNEQIVENCTSNTELMPNGVAGLLKNGECSGNMYNFCNQEEVSLTAHSKGKVSRKSTFLPETEAPKNMNFKPAQISIIKESQKINSKKHDRITYKPYSKSKSSKMATDMLDIKINQNKENFAGRSNAILYSIVYDNNQNNYENITDECLNMTGQRAECRPNDNIASRTNILGHECNNKFSTPTTATKISANLKTCNKTVKLCKNKEGKYNASINTKHSFYPNNCVQSDSLCERSNSANESDSSITTSYNESQKLGYHESIENSRINIRNTNNSFTCDICQYRTSDLYKIVDHLEKNDHNQRHCTICTYIFRDNKEFKMHLKVHKGKKPFLCLECNKPFVRLSGFNKHSLNHHNEKPLTCSICGATFKLQHSFHRHMRTKHNKNEGRIYMCEHCSYSALTRSDLAAHLNNNCIHLSKCSEPNNEFETGRRKVSSVLHNNKNSKIPIKRKTTFTANKNPNHVLENHFTDSCRTTKSSLHTDVCNIRFKCSDCNYWTTKQNLYKKHVKKWHSQNKKSLNNPVHNIRNSVISLPTANNSSQLTGKNDAKVSERNSGVQRSIERVLLINNNSNSIDNKQMTNVSQHHCTQIDKNGHNLLLMNNTEQLHKINAEEVILPINNTQVTNIASTVLGHFTATNDIVLLLNVDDHQNMYQYSLLPLIQPSAKEQLPDDFQLTSENRDNIINLNNVEDSSCKSLDSVYSSDSFSTASLLSLENSGGENNIEYSIPIIHCTEEFSPVADLQNITAVKNVDEILCESTSNELVHSRNNENELITNMPNNSFNEQNNIMFLDQEQSQSYLSGVCDPWMSDGIQDLFQMDLNTTEVTDNIEYNEFFYTNL